VTYARAYGEPLSSILEERYATLATELFDGAHDGDTTVAALPEQPRDLLTPAFLAAHEAGGAPAHRARQQGAARDLAAAAAAGPTRRHRLDRELGAGAQGALAEGLEGGPEEGDRMLAIQLIGTTGVGVLMLLSRLLAQPALLDVALVLALLAAVASAAFTAQPREDGDA